jgi:hypothetical protein
MKCCLKQKVSNVPPVDTHPSVNVQTLHVIIPRLGPFPPYSPSPFTIHYPPRQTTLHTRIYDSPPPPQSPSITMHASPRIIHLPHPSRPSSTRLLSPKGTEKMEGYNDTNNFNQTQEKIIGFLIGSVLAFLVFLPCYCFLASRLNRRVFVRARARRVEDNSFN